MKRFSQPISTYVILFLTLVATFGYSLGVAASIKNITVLTYSPSATNTEMAGLAADNNIVTAVGARHHVVLVTSHTLVPPRLDALAVPTKARELGDSVEQPQFFLPLVLQRGTPVASATATVTPSPRPSLTPTPTPTLTPTPTPTPSVAPGGQLITYVPSAGIGNIAVRISLPTAPRYADGASVVVDIATFFTSANDFQEDLDAPALGLIRIAYLWPGKSSRSGAASDGTYDYGGETDIQALRDVIRFASGQIPDKDGRYLADLIPIHPLTDQVGLYAFSHPGIAAVNVLALYGEQLPHVGYFVGRENPTVDTISAVEIGHWADDGSAVYNPLYQYPDSYTPTQIILDYSSARWDADYSDSHSSYLGRPYFDLNDNGLRDSSDYTLGYKVPSMFGKRVYSTAMTQALHDNGSLSDADWPADLATPAEAASWWAFRSSTQRYPNLTTKAPNLKVMLVFARRGHVLPAPDKPQIHQAYDGFHHGAGLWTRLNPDAAYLIALNPRWGPGDVPEHPANTEPSDWNQIEDWAYPNSAIANTMASLAAVAEMADRLHENRWEADLDEVLLGGDDSTATPTPTTSPSTDSIPPLYVFYTIHTQLGESYYPYTSPDLTTIDPQRLRNMTALVKGIRRIADEHGFKITWEFTRSLAKGLCTSPVDGSLLSQMQSDGHEIALYAHTNGITTTQQTLIDACGISAEVLGGYMIDVGLNGVENAQETMSQAIAIAAANGFDTGTENLSPAEEPSRNPFAALCDNQIGVGNDMWAQTGNLLFPWRPDYRHENICADDPDGDFLFVDHVGADWMRDSHDRFVPTLSDDNFAVLQAYLDGALSYMADNRPSRLAAWGFVSHISEYTPRNDATALPSPAALASLDRFLTYLEQKAEEGRIVFTTVSGIAEQVMGAG
ncbi:MAG: hypothetical protein GXP38_05905 [Chloroflexi bacterium]|nr:hypothetical protein [Chloroflexota bacterium]